MACPMFSGLWAIANEEAKAPLGQAAQYPYSLPAGATTDIVPVTSKTNVKASIVESTGNSNYTPGQVLGGATSVAPAKFISAIWDYAFQEDTSLVISFGMDCSALPSGDGTSCNIPTALHTEVGWDNVTGVGTPNGKAFAHAFKPELTTVK